MCAFSVDKDMPKRYQRPKESSAKRRARRLRSGMRAYDRLARAAQAVDCHPLQSSALVMCIRAFHKRHSEGADNNFQGPCASLAQRVVDHSQPPQGRRPPTPPLAPLCGPHLPVDPMHLEHLRIHLTRAGSPCVAPVSAVSGRAPQPVVVMLALCEVMTSSLLWLILCVRGPSVLSTLSDLNGPCNKAVLGPNTSSSCEW